MDGRIGRTEVTPNSLFRNILRITHLPSIFCGRQRGYEQDKYSRINNLAASTKKILKADPPSEHGGSKLSGFLQCGTRRFEPAGGDGSEAKASDVRQIPGWPAFRFLLSNRKQMRVARPFDSAQGWVLRSWQGRAAMPPTHMGPSRCVKVPESRPSQTARRTGHPPALVMSAKSKSWATRRRICPSLQSGPPTSGNFPKACL